MIPYVSGALLCVSAPGKDNGDLASGLFGTLRSRSGAKLKYTENDIRVLSEKLPTYGSYTESQLLTVKLTNPTKCEVIKQIDFLVGRLSQTPADSKRKKVLNIIYAGHGCPHDGSWDLCDGLLNAGDVYQQILQSYGTCENRLHLDLILDSCYSSRFLIDLLVISQDQNRVYPFDCFISSLPDEKSWEMDFLLQGALSYVLCHEGNAHVDSKELAQAIDSQDHRIIAKYLQGTTIPNPVTFLTNGRQHGVELTSGHYLEVQGAGSVSLVEVSEKLTHSGLADCLYRASQVYGEKIQYLAI